MVSAKSWNCVVGLDVVRLHVLAQAAAKIVRRERLPERADVVALAFDGQQRGAVNRAGIDLAVAPRQLAFCQRVILEDALDGLEIELRGQIGDREIFLVEAARGFGFLLVVVDKILEKSAKRTDVALEIHVQERGQLQKAWIDLAQRAAVAHRNGRN